MNSYRTPYATWLGQLPNSNFDVDRTDTDGTQHSMTWVSASDPSFIVLHTMVGHADAATARFDNPAAQVSATYGVKLDGGLVQWVDEKDAPYAEGNWEYNLNSIAIEHEDNSSGGVYSGGYTDAQYAASGKLVREICLRYGIPINRTYILKHKEVPGASTACPDALDVDRIIAIANGAAPVVAPEQIIAPSQLPPAGVSGVVYAGPDLRFFDFNTEAPVGQSTTVGTGLTWTTAKLTSSGWLLGGGSMGTRALLDSCVDDSDATHDAAHSSPTDFIITPVVDPLLAIEARLAAVESSLKDIELKFATLETATSKVDERVVSLENLRVALKALL